MNTYVIGLDVGGTSLKSALVDSTGSMMGNSFNKTLVNNQDTADNILNTFCCAISVLLGKVELKQVLGIGIGMPGPFDYTRGISRMKHKFAALYGIDLNYDIRKRLALPRDFTIRFGPDSWYFTRGEMWLGAAQGYDRVIGVTLGTGLGSAFMAGDHMVENGPGIPPHTWIGALPYNGGTVEDKVSRRGIIARYKEIGGQTLEVEEIAKRALLNKDKDSLRVFSELGHVLGEILAPHADAFKAECMVFGGGISKSFGLFSSPILAGLSSVPTVKKVTQGAHIDLSPIWGAAKIVFLGSSYVPPVLDCDKIRWYSNED